jgi:hypothetical protein
MGDDEQVGYGKPPKQHQFKTGQSGNPRGRPKDRKNARATFRDLLNETVVVHEKGRKKRMRKVDVIFNQMINKALTGDPQAMRNFRACCRELGYNDERAQGLVVVISAEEAQI